ncbi:hypothetical protein BRW62_01135 [Parathermosynechococcus lividus PCC 6715]|uniref:Uncharacterized protein n=1 Tax=Parathermosynechococcus lividus PCC 6715 TaxID=1917166 RepID=A0A2D2PZ94_PARLV|nr:hypothetical protein BRW62_01135 [Thermostichus lividus PCC 6715]
MGAKLRAQAIAREIVLILFILPSNPTQSALLGVTADVSMNAPTAQMGNFVKLGLGSTPSFLSLIYSSVGDLSV